MSGVFLAHSSTDKRFVRKLAADLMERGVRVWFDEAEMLIGDSLFAKIAQGIRDMDFLAVILSPASVGSPWVQREVEIALSEELAGSLLKVLPILYKPCEIPSFLRPKLWLDFSKSREYSKSLERLLRRLSPAATGDSELLTGWTPKAVRLGVLCGLVVTKGGKVQLADSFVKTLHEQARLWAEGKIELDSSGELVARSAAKTIAGERAETLIPLTLDETHYLFSHLSRQVLNVLLDVGTRAKIVTLGDGHVAILQSLTDEVIESIAAHAADRLGGEKDVRPFVVELFVEVVGARLQLYEPGMMHYCYPLAMLVFSLFESSAAYRDLERLGG